eukprot:6555368-Pyramimonas_sp.AAC.1
MAAWSPSGEQGCAGCLGYAATGKAHRIGGSALSSRVLHKCHSIGNANKLGSPVWAPSLLGSPQAAATVRWFRDKRLRRFDGSGISGCDGSM